MADKTSDELLEKVRALLGDEAAAVVQQHQELTEQLEKAKSDLAAAKKKKAELDESNNDAVSGLMTRQADVERREREITERENKVVQIEEDQKLTAHALGLREQALVPQEQDYRRRLTEVSDKEQEVIRDATELKTLRDELIKQAHAQQEKEDALNATKETLKAAQAEILKQKKGTE